MQIPSLNMCNKTFSCASYCPAASNQIFLQGYNNLALRLKVKSSTPQACLFRKVRPVVADAVIAAFVAGAFLVVADLIVPITVRFVAGADFAPAPLDVAVLFLMTVPVLASLDSLA